MQIATLGRNQTMSSREIAALVGSQHDTALKTIRRLIEEGVVSANETPYTHLQNGQVYTEFLLSYRDTMVVASGFNSQMRARIVDRWMALEAGQSHQVPTTLAQALRLAADQSEKIETQQLQIDAQQPAVEFVGRYVEATGLKGFRQVAKLLQVKEPIFREFLSRNRIMYQLGGEWTAYSQHIDAGRFVIKAGVNEDTGHAYNPSKFTPKGVEWVAGIMASENAVNALRAA